MAICTVADSWSVSKSLPIQMSIACEPGVLLAGTSMSGPVVKSALPIRIVEAVVLAVQTVQ